MSENTNKLRSDFVVVEESLAKAKTQADPSGPNATRLSTDKVRLGEEKLAIERDASSLRTQVLAAADVKKERDALANERKELTNELSAARTKASDAEKAVREKDKLASGAHGACNWPRPS